jgi:probable HAF family extracellular repeat protein
LYTHGTMVDLGASGASAAYGINDHGDVVGSGNGAFFYHNGVMTDIVGPYSTAYGINNLGQIVGQYLDTAAQRYHSFIYTNGTLTGLATPGDSSAGQVINDSGTVAGYYWALTRLGQGTFPFEYSDGTFTDIHGFGGLNNWIGGINKSGQVVGTSSPEAGGTSEQAFLYSDGKLTRLGPEQSVAYAINDSGTVVGAVESAQGGPAILFPDGWTNLNTLIPPGTGWTLGYARAINDAGQIAGYGRVANGDFDAFLLTPVPEPSGLGLLGLAGVGLGRRRKRE